MAFLDKLTDAAAMIGDKASDAVETTKIKTKINGEKRDAEAELAKLGRIYYDKAKACACDEVPQEVQEIICRIDNHYAEIEALEKQLSEI